MQYMLTELEKWRYEVIRAVCTLLGVKIVVIQWQRNISERNFSK